jgi:hypothetical protein
MTLKRTTVRQTSTMANEEYESLEDLVFSRSFRNWVLKGDTPEAGFWTNWVALNPRRIHLVNHAKALIYALQLDLRPLSEEAIDAEVEKVLQKLKDGRLSLVREIPFRPGRLGRRPARAWAIAATLAGVCIVAWSLRLYLHRQRENVFRTFLAANTAKPIRRQTVDADSSILLTLPDGSMARLSRGSKLWYPEGLVTAGRHREVFLEGEAFFDIARNG